MASNKDSNEVVEFMTLFSRLKEWSDRDPESLPKLADDDDSVKELCLQLDLAATLMSANERHRRELFAAPVDQKFLNAWREYEERYRIVLSGIFWAYLTGETTAAMLDKQVMRAAEWENADGDAARQVDAIERGISFLQDEIEQDDRDFPEEFIEEVEDGIAAWERLKHDTGFDLRGVFRRRPLIPFVLVPRHVAGRMGSGKKASFYDNLQQAHEAFIFGVPRAALGLMRSILEAVLRDHYGALGNDLSERISNVASRLPHGANSAALHRLRKLAISVLHLDHGKGDRLSNLEQGQLEIEIVSLFYVLRSLIEGAPQWLPR